MDSILHGANEFLKDIYTVIEYHRDVEKIPQGELQLILACIITKSITDVAGISGKSQEVLSATMSTAWKLSQTMENTQ